MVKNVKFVIQQSTTAEFISSSGVPQGSNLGPLLFFIFINDLTYCVPPDTCLMYADDVKLFLPVKSPNDCINLQNIINGFGTWCLKHDLNIRC